MEKIKVENEDNLNKLKENFEKLKLKYNELDHKSEEKLNRSV